MHEPTSSSSQAFDDLIAEITALKPSLDSLIAEFRAVVSRLELDTCRTEFHFLLE